MNKIYYFLKLLRPHQYVKNCFVFLGLLFGHKWDYVTLEQSLIVFLAFCCMASAVYILNDLIDLEADLKHPIKCRRPLPAGLISITLAKISFVLLALFSVILAFYLNYLVLIFIVSYLLINVFYSLHLKHIVIVDVFIISLGFMLRILAGTVGLGIQPSAWLLLCGLMVTLFLGFAKRLAELMVLNVGEQSSAVLTRRVLDDYSPQMLEQFISVTAACTIITYGLYTVSPQTQSLHGGANLIYTLPFVVYGIFRYLFLLHRRSKGSDTSKDLLQDIHLLFTSFLWIGTTVLVIS